MEIILTGNGTIYRSMHWSYLVLRRSAVAAVRRGHLARALGSLSAGTACLLLLFLCLRLLRATFLLRILGFLDVSHALGGNDDARDRLGLLDGDGDRAAGEQKGGNDSLHGANGPGGSLSGAAGGDGIHGVSFHMWACRCLHCREGRRCLPCVCDRLQKQRSGRLVKPDEPEASFRCVAVNRNRKMLAKLAAVRRSRRHKLQDRPDQPWRPAFGL